MGRLNKAAAAEQTQREQTQEKQVSAVKRSVSQLRSSTANARLVSIQNNPDETHRAEQAQEAQGGETVLVRRSKRRWTHAADGREGLPIMHRPSFEDGDAPSSTVDTPFDTPLSSRRPSLQDGQRATRITFEGERPAAARSSESRPAEDAEDSSSQKSHRSTSTIQSSLVWRMDALDCGDRLAAASAVKKGGTSVQSIVELVQGERERWADEKSALEAKLEELKEQLSDLHRQRGPDPEKEALRRQFHELRQAMKARSRFGAWVCERHMQESDDEDQGRNAEKEDLRRQLAQVGAELRIARRQVAGRSPTTPTSEDLDSPRLQQLLAGEVRDSGASSPT